MKNKTTAGLLALLLGGLGVHKFYLGKPRQGLLYLLFTLTYIPAILGILEGIVYLCNSQTWFDYNYNKEELEKREREEEIRELRNLHKEFLHKELNGK